MSGLSLIAKKLYGNKTLRQEFVEVASSASKGLPRKAKKDFYKTLLASTKPEQTKRATQQMGSILKRNRMQRVLSTQDSQVAPYMKSINSAHAQLDTLEDMMKLSAVTRPAMIKNIVASEMKQMKIDIPPVTLNLNTEKIAKEVVAETKKDAMTLAKRVVAYPITKTLSLFVTKSRKVLCEGLMSETKDVFAGKYYKKLLEQKGIVDKAPKEVVITNKSAGLNVNNILISNAKNCEGGFNPYTNTIEFTKEMKTLSRAQQAGLIEHELLHGEQSYIMIQTYGIDAYISALKTRAVNLLSKTPEYKNCSSAELQKLVEKEINTDSIKKAFSGAINAPKIDKNSKLGKKAKEYLDATSNYTPPEKNGILTTATEEYKTNALEVEAYKKQKNATLATMILENMNLSCV